MGFLDSLRKAIQGPVHVGGGGDDPGEVAAGLHEEYIPPHTGDAELEEVQGLSEGTPAPSAVAAFSGTGQIHATEIETGLESGIEPEEDEGPINPDT